jgi:hypothetical protein
MIFEGISIDTLNITAKESPVRRMDLFEKGGYGWIGKFE